MGFLYLCISGLISSYLFIKLFEGLNKSRLKLLVPLQRFIRKSKIKGLYSFISLFVFFLIAYKVKELFKLNDIVLGIMLSVPIALDEVIFERIIYRINIKSKNIWED